MLRRFQLLAPKEFPHRAEVDLACPPSPGAVAGDKVNGFGQLRRGDRLNELFAGGHRSPAAAFEAVTSSRVTMVPESSALSAARQIRTFS